MASGTPPSVFGPSAAPNAPPPPPPPPPPPRIRPMNQPGDPIINWSDWQLIQEFLLPKSMSDCPRRCSHVGRVVIKICIFFSILLQVRPPKICVHLTSSQRTNRVVCWATQDFSVVAALSMSCVRSKECGHNFYHHCRPSQLSNGFIYRGRNLPPGLSLPKSPV